MVFNGQIVNSLNYPFFGILRWKNTSGGPGFFCGCSFLGGPKNACISAAHCVAGKNPEDIQAEFMKSSLSDDGVFYNVKKIIIPKKYVKGNFNFDIAIIHLSEKPALPVIPIEIPDRKLGRFLKKPYNNVNIIGFGGDGRAKYFNDLNSANVQIVRKKKSRFNRYPTTEISQKLLLATGYEDESRSKVICDACLGDSGGPLFANHEGKTYLIGTITGGRGCAVEGYPGIYSNILKFKGFISKKAEL